MAAPTYANALGTVRSNASSTSWVADIPSGVAVDDLMIACIFARSQLATISAVPSGWNLIRSTTGSGLSAALWMYWKIATSSDIAGSTYTWTGPNLVTKIVTSRITGHDPTTPVNDSNGLQNAASTTVTFPAVVTTVADTLIIPWGVTLTNTTAGSWSGSLVERWDSGVAGGSANTSFGGSQEVAAIGDTGTFTAVIGGSAATLCQTLAIASPAAPKSLLIPTETAFRILSRR